MKPDEFQTGCPGSLVPTVGTEEVIDGQGRRSVRQVRAVAFVPKPLPPELDLGQLLVSIRAELSQADRALGILDGLADDLQYARLLTAPLMQREAIVSSKIEDTIATPREVAQADNERPGASLQAKEVANYRRCLMHGLGSELPLCVRLVCEMHGVLLTGTRGAEDRPGEVRQTQNRIGGRRDSFESARFVPPPPGDTLSGAMKNLERFWNGEAGGLPALVAAAIAHYQFEAIHPFNDGNGRIGRAIIVLWLCRERLLREPLVYVSGYFERHRREYYDHLYAVSTRGAWSDWCRFFLEAVASEAHDAAKRMRAIREMRSGVVREISERRLPAALITLVDRVIEGASILDVERARRLLGVSDPTARKYLRHLQDIGFLDEVSGGRYGQEWEATRLFQLIEADLSTTDSSGN